MLVVNQFAVQNSLITPVALALGEAPPPKIQDQRWLAVLSGVVLLDLKGTLANDWTREGIGADVDLRGPLQQIVNRHGIPQPPGNAHEVRLQVDRSVPFATLSAVFNQSQSGQAGYAVDAWRMALSGTERDAFTNALLPRLFVGIQADLAVRNKAAVVHRFSYHMTLIGKIVFAKTQIIL